MSDLAPASSTALSPYLARYTAKKAMFNFLGTSFRIYAPDGKLAFYVKQKAFKLKEEITVYADEKRTRPMLRIKARQVLDVSATYDVTDANTGEVVGALRRHGLRSILRDKWLILGEGDKEIGQIEEDTGILALVRRFLLKLIPQSFNVTMHGRSAGRIKQRFNPFVLVYDVEFPSDGTLDLRLGVAAVVLLLAIEGRQG